LTETQSEDAVDISEVIEENTEPSIPIIHISDVSDQQFKVQLYSNVIELPFELLKSLSEDSLLNNTSTEIIFTEQDLCTSSPINTEVQTGL